MFQLEQMNELIRNAVVNCPHCSFSTGNIDEMNRHLLFHLIATQQQIPPAMSNEHQALASIYQRLTGFCFASFLLKKSIPLAQLHQELVPEGQLIPTGLAQDPSSLLSRALAVSSAQQGNEVPLELEKARQMEREAAESIRQQQSQQGPQFTPTTVAALLNAAGVIDCTSEGVRVECSGGTTSSSSNSEPVSSANCDALKKEFPQFGFGLAGEGIGTEKPIMVGHFNCLMIKNKIFSRKMILKSALGELA